MSYPLNNPINSFLKAASEGTLEDVKSMLPHVNINVVGDHHDTALHHAVLQRKFDIVDFLVRSGAKIDIKDSEGRTPVDIAKDNHFQVALKMMGVD